MEIEEIDALIHAAEAEMKAQEAEKKKIMRQKSLTNKARETKLEPIEEVLTYYR